MDLYNGPTESPDYFCGLQETEKHLWSITSHTHNSTSAQLSYHNNNNFYKPQVT